METPLPSFVIPPPKVMGQADHLQATTFHGNRYPLPFVNPARACDVFDLFVFSPAVCPTRRCIIEPPDKAVILSEASFASYRKQIGL